MAENSSESETLFPRQPVDRIVKPLARFLHIEAASGILLLICAVAALVIANSAFAPAYLKFWKTYVGFEFGTFQFRHPLYHLVNDGLMAVFFFVIGLEVKRELVLGELRDMRRAALPIAAALGGMLVPAGIYLSLQFGEAGERGWGIPMATDIAFVVGCMALLGSRVPRGLRVMLLSLAIADDIGAILVIAIGYTDTLYFSWLVAGRHGIDLRRFSFLAAWRPQFRCLRCAGNRHLVCLSRIRRARHDRGRHFGFDDSCTSLPQPDRIRQIGDMDGPVLAR